MGDNISSAAQLNCATSSSDVSVIASCETDGSAFNQMKRNLLMTSELRYFIDMVYLHASSSNLFPPYIEKEEFKICIENIRKVDWDLVDPNGILEYVAVRDAYVCALIVYGFIKELAVKGDSSAASSYGVLSLLMPFKI